MTIHFERQKFGRVLLISRDFAATQQLAEVIERHEMSVEVSMDIASAWYKLNHRKYEAVLVDAQFGRKSLDVLQQIRLSAANRTAVTFAITTGQEDTGQALKHGFSFALERPLTADCIAHTLRVAYGLIVRERRRYFRCPIVVPAVLSRKGAPEIYARTINISEGGLAIHSSDRLEPGWETNIEFTLNDPKLRIRSDSRVCWQSENGNAGLSFVAMCFDLTSALSQWLALKLEEELPSYEMTEV